MKVFGLTGGIASGKSTAATMFRELGAPIVDADRVARDVVAPGQPALAEIVARFGTEVLDAGGHLDRKRLGAIVFDDADARRDLERITHPRIAAASQAQLAAIAASGTPVALYEAALIVENGLHRGLAGLIVVAVPALVQRDRLMARDGIDAAAADTRLAAQLPLSAKIAVADHVIDNSGERADTRRQVEAIWAALTGDTSAPADETTP